MRSLYPALLAAPLALTAPSCGQRAPSPASSPSPIAAPLPAPPTAALPDPESHLERDGLAIHFALKPLSADPTRLDPRDEHTAVFTITDAKTGAPIGGLAPLAWMSRRDGPPPDDTACREKIKSYRAGLLSTTPDVDMNTHLLWTLNDDSSLSVINPQVAFSKTKLQRVVSLAGRGAAFAMHPEGDTVYVTLPAARSVAFVDARRGLVTTNVPVGDTPTQVVVAPDGRTVWIGNDGDDTVSVLDARSGVPLSTLRVGRGHHEIVFANRQRDAWIISRDAERAVVVDTADLEVLREVEIGAGATSISASDTASAVYVANPARGEMLLLDVEHRTLAGRIPLRPGVATVQFEPRGRFAFALNPEADELTILDGATGQPRHTLSHLARPDVVAFTPTFAYVRSLDANRVSLLDLAALERPDTPAVVDVQIGQRAPREARDAAQGAPIVALPEGNGAIIGSPGDKALYYYVEGMMAPLGTLLNHGRAPRSVLLEDRSLHEKRPGVYETTVRVGSEGMHDVALLLGSRRLAACLDAKVEPSLGTPATPPPGVTFEPLFDTSAEAEVGAPVTLRFRATPTTTGGASAAPLDPAHLDALIFRFPSGFRWSGAPQAEGDGAFSVTFTPTHAGEYRLMVGVDARGAPMGTLPWAKIKARPRRDVAVEESASR
ncbi:YncE family protein [Chondromyces crocatus]|uniref:Uncharacterized protein n=1 Tax=Chondromyces crocatus TaxID=52 RepID=A0A0K1EPY2_CHOCO|nr:YncE family protein [Chondromyces crocatus]AKT42985.1 uncharacterized protein CMC5_072130 [Chondromyces crocatus]